VKHDRLALSALPTAWVCSLVAVSVLLVLSGCTAAPDPSTAASADPSGYRGGIPVKDPYTMPRASLTDTAGQSYNLATSPSKPVTLLFFGYTSCPDVCIAVMNDVAMALGRIASQDRDQIQVVFVTTDPARDTPTKIRHYLDQFDPDFIGLTGSSMQIQAVADRVGVNISGVQRLAGGGYEIAHSAQVIGFTRDRGVVVWPQSTAVGALAHDFAVLVDRSR
jgi:protein SCO1/2